MVKSFQVFRRQGLIADSEFPSGPGSLDLATVRTLAWPIQDIQSFWPMAQEEEEILYYMYRNKVCGDQETCQGIEELASGP